MRTQLTKNILKHYDERPECFNKFNSYNNIVIPVLRLVDGHRRLTSYDLEYDGWDLYKDELIHFKAICSNCNTILYKNITTLEEFHTKRFNITAKGMADAFEEIERQFVSIREKKKKEKFNRRMRTIGNLMIGTGVLSVILTIIYVFLKWNSY